MKRVKRLMAERAFRRQENAVTAEGERLIADLPEDVEISVLYIDAEKKHVLLQGELSSPINPKPGCRFATRCPFAKPECTGHELELKEVAPNHFVKCVLV